MTLATLALMWRQLRRSSATRPAYPLTVTTLHVDGTTTERILP